MMLDKGLVLKGLAGVAAVGGIATTGVALKEGTALNKLLFPSPKADAGDQNDQTGAENAREDKQDESKTSQDHSTHQEQDTGVTGATGSQLRTDNAPVAIVSSPSTPSPAEDAYGIPTKCKTTSPCDLTEDELKKIKFEVLGDEDTPEVTVENYPSETGQKVSLIIDSTDTTKKKYIFSNGSSKEVKIKKGEDKTVSLPSGRTKFTLDTTNNKLKQFDLGDYGLPKEGCDNSCTLTYTDLEDIKFDGLDGPLTVSPTNKTVSLSVESVSSEKRFTFSTSSSSITIKNSSNQSVTLSSPKTRFKGESNKMKKIELDDKGIPRDCTGTCTLTADDLKEVKFPGFDKQTGDVTVEPSNQTISLTITNGDDYSFNNGSGQITIKKGGASVILTASQGTQFHIKDGKLVNGKKKSEAEIFNEKIKKAGFSDEESCKFQEGNTSEEIECQLTKEQFKVLKFKELDGGEVDENTLSSGIGGNFKVKIKKIKPQEKVNYPTGTDLKFIFDGLDINSLSIQKKNDGSKTIYLKKNSNTEFIVVNSSGMLERAWNRQTLGNKLGLSCSSGNPVECTVAGPINLIVSGNQKHEGMSKTGSGEGKFKVTTSHDYREGYRFKVENSNITLSKESQTETLTTNNCYQAKWDTDNKWWLAWKENSCS